MVVCINPLKTFIDKLGEMQFLLCKVVPHLSKMVKCDETVTKDQNGLS